MHFGYANAVLWHLRPLQQRRLCKRQRPRGVGGPRRGYVGIDIGQVIVRWGTPICSAIERTSAR